MHLKAFDIVCSAVMLHETSSKALPRVMEETYRLLRPGGIAVHLEVPVPYRDLDLWQTLRSNFEVYYNNEPFWRGANMADLGALLANAGFKSVDCGYQDAVPEAVRDAAPGFSHKPGTVYGSWLIASGRKPA